jgi:hypothetical protein
MTDVAKHLSKTEQVNEIIKCGKEPLYFIKKYAKIQHPTRGTLPFDTYPFQDECVEQFQEHRLNIVLKSRQLGLSTLSAAYAVWLAIFYKDKNILVIATKLPTAMNFIKKVRFMLDNLPSWLLLPKFEPTKQSIGFSNGSQVTAIPTSDDAGRSEALSLLIIDEAAFIRDFDTIWTGLAPTFSTGGSAIILSTPNGVGGQYYSLWTQAEAGQNDFNPIRIPWDKHPEHDQAWFDKETRSLPRRKIAQEYLCDFISSGDTFLQPNDLEYLRSQIMDPIEKGGHDRNVWIWSPPVVGHTYAISADVSRGDAGDYSTFHIVDVEDCEVAAEYMGKVPPEKLADMLNEWGLKYNEAMIVPENNSFGYFVNTKLRDVHGYKKLYYHGVDDPWHYIPLDSSQLPGFPTNAKTRVQILAKLEEMIRGKTLKSYSRRLHDQLQSFIWNGNKPMAGKDSHDDLVMSIAIACWMVEGGEGISANAHAMAIAMLEATRLHRKDFSQMPGGINEAQPLVNPAIKGVNAHSVYRPRDPSQVAPQNPMLRDTSDFSWLLR